MSCPRCGGQLVFECIDGLAYFFCSFCGFSADCTRGRGVL